MLAFASLALALGAARAASRLDYTPTPHGALVALPGGLSVELAVEGLASFRVSLGNATTPSQLATSMVAPKAQYAAFTVLTSGALVNLSAPGLGSLALDAGSGVLTLSSATGAVLTTSDPLVRALGGRRAWPTVAGHQPLQAARNDTCEPRQVGVDVSGPERSQAFPNGLAGQSEDQCCAACNSDATCIAWVWSDGSHADPAGNCWPLSGYAGTHQQAGRVLGGFTPPPPPPPPGTAALRFSASPGAVYVGAGTDGPGAQTLARAGAQAQVFNKGSWTPSFYSSDGWGMLAVSPFPNTAGPAPGAANGVYGVQWQRDATGVQISILGGSGPPGPGGANVDLYLTPASTLRAHVGAQAALQGYAAVPPRYALGFLACRWGWTNQAYIEGVLAEFRSGAFPIDSFISDFEWFTARPDYTLPSSGDPNYHDFSYNNITFPAPQGPLLARYRSQYNFRFGGIRKPRLGNSDALVMAQSKGWLMGQGGDPSGRPNGSRNTNFSLPAFFDYYSSANAGYLQDGVQFFWNDEGEDDYFTFSQWSASQVQGLAAYDASRRYFSINRAFAPGAARLGAIAWTGDISDTWGDLANQPGYFLNWGIAGQPWVTCDTGGFAGGDESALLLARWYGMAAAMPVMRVHSTNSDVPHFPFPELWGQEASDAMRAHLVLRYALLPYTYSLAHVTHRTGVPLARPLALQFPGDAAAAGLTAQWMLGEGVLVAPVLSADNATTAYLPAGLWYAWGSGSASTGPTTLALTAVPLGRVPMYALAGSIVPTAPPLQFSDALPGGPLQVAVYAGADGVFTLYEDDGETRAYDSASPAVATTELSWDNASGCLSWAKGGASPNPAGARAFTQVATTVFSQGGTKSAAAADFTVSGKVCPQ